MSVRVARRWSARATGLALVLPIATLASFAAGCEGNSKGPETPGVGIGESTAARVSTEGTSTTSQMGAKAPMPLSGSTQMQGASTPRATTMPSDQEIRRVIDAAHAQFKGLGDGKNADYIPALAKVDSKLFGVSVVLPNGEVIETGDTKTPFAIESIAKVFALARLIEDKGAEGVEKAVGVDATGMPFNSVMAVELNKPHHAGNPFVNAGAITTVSLLPAKNGAERWDRLKRTLDSFAGRELAIDQEVYKSETETNQHNRGIAYLLQSYDVIKGDPAEALDLYTRECSVSVTAHDLAVMGATLANGGVNPVTHQRVVSPETASHVLAMMMTAGLYETTGTWVYRVGVPAKSGVGGGIIAVVPGKYAISAFSPPLDEAGNSVRAQKAIESVVHDLSGNLFAVGDTAGTPSTAPRASAPTTKTPTQAATQTGGTLPRGAANNGR